MQRRVLFYFLFTAWFLASGQTSPFSPLKVGQNQALPPLLSAVEDPFGRLWLGTEGQGVWMFTGGRVKAFNREQGLPNDFIRALAWDSKGNLWAGTEDGIAWFDGRVWQQPVGDFPHSNRVNQLVAAPNGDVYLLCREGMYVSNGLEISPFRAGVTATVGAWWNKALWFAHGAQLESTSGEILPLSFSSNSGVFISSLVPRQDTLFWSGPSASGYVYKGKVVVLDQEPGQLFEATPGDRVLVRRGQKLKLGMRGPTVVHPEVAHARGFLNLRNGDVLLYGNNGAGVVPGTVIQRVDVFVEDRPTLVHTVVETPEGLLLGTDKGLVKPIEGGHEVLFAACGQVFDVLPWEDDYVLVAENGAWIWNKSGSVILQKGFWLSGLVHHNQLFLAGPEGAFVFGKNAGLPTQKEGAFMKVIPVGNGRVALLSFDGKAYVMDHQGKEEVFLAPDSVEITGFALLNNNPLWATRDKGLLLNNAPWPTRQSTLAQVLGMVQDDQGIWVNTGTNLLFFEGASPHHCVGVAGPGMGLGVLEGHGSPIVSENKGVYLGLSTGYLRAGQVRVQAPGVLIYAAEILARDAEDEWQPWTFLPVNTSLGFQENYLRFGFAATGESSGESPRFFYRLSPLDKDWAISTSGEVLYPNLPAGTFTLEVSRADAAGIPGEIATFTFSITPPFWKRFWFWFLILSLVFTGIYFYFKSRLEAVEIQASLERELAEMERKALGLQMSPHFIFNALDSISSFIFKNDPQSAVKYLTSFAKLMRSTLEASREHLIPLQTEVTILQNYLALENLRFSESIHFEISIEDEVLLEGRIPPMLVQPLVENAVKHGLRGLDYPPQLLVSFERHEESLRIVVQDNGRGRSAAEARDKEGHRSVGTTILERRLSLIGKTLGGEALLRYEDLTNSEGVPSGTRAILLLPWVDEDWSTDEP